MDNNSKLHTIKLKVKYINPIIKWKNNYNIKNKINKNPKMNVIKKWIKYNI